MSRVRRFTTAFMRNLRRPNVEKVAVILAAAWLLAMWVGYADAPEFAPWGPARTEAIGARSPSVSFEGPDPLDLEGGDPFHRTAPAPTVPGVETEPDGEKLDIGEIDAPQVDPPVVEVENETTTGSTGGDRNQAASGPHVALVGSMEVERKGRWFVFEETSTERCHLARKGDRIGELGLCVVGMKDRTPLVEYVPPPRSNR